MMTTEQKPQEQSRTEEQSPRSQKGTWDIRPYLAIGLTAILVVLVCLAIFFFIYRFQGFSDGVAQIISSIQAVIIGFILAYLLNPVMKFFERIYNKKLFLKSGKIKNRPRLIRSLAVATAMAVFLAVVFVLVMMLVPQLVTSIQELVLTMGDKMDALISWVERLVNNTELAGQIERLAEEGFAALENWLREQFLNNGDELVTQLTTGVVSVVKTIFNIIVGMIVAVYVLMTKERFVGQAKKIVYAVFRPKAGNTIMEVFRKADEVFIGYFIGYIIDSMIVGCICFVGMNIIRLPYAPLISVIVGVTNIIPYFGPYIGAIPSAILIFLVNPIQAVYFLIMVLVIQQIDGNVIAPKILGNSTGLSPFWVVFAILLMGGCFGIVGMVFGVPVFAMVYYLVKRIVEHFLRRRKLPTDTATFTKLDRVDPETNEVKEQTEKEKEKSVLHSVKHNRNDKKED